MLKKTIAVLLLFSICSFAQTIDGLKSISYGSFKQKKVQKYINYFAKSEKGKAFFTGTYPRMGKYEKNIKDIFLKYQIPDEIIYVSMLESGFNQNALSKAGALGLWQFMPSSARIFGLRVDDWVDERKDIDKSTEAAAKYFRSLMRKFNSWELAFAGYNSGDLTVKRAIKKYNSNDFWYLSNKTFPKQTKEYVPQIIALMIISQDLSKYGFGELKLQAPLKTKKVMVDESTSLEYLSKLIDLDNKVLKELNPSLLKGITPPDTEYAVNIPLSKIKTLYAKLNRNNKRIVGEYLIKKGDTISKIAIKFNISIEEIYKLNNLHDSKIIAGKKLLIYLNSQNTLKDGKYFTHIVKRGESLYKISKEYEIKVKDLKEWNNLSNSKIIVGQKLRVRLANE